MALVVLARCGQSERLLIRLSRKRRDARQEDIKNHPHRPNVDRQAVPVGACQNFRGNVTWRTAQARCRLIPRYSASKAEVCNLDCCVGVGRRHEEVLGLQIPVCDTPPMKVTQSTHNLSHDTGRNFFREVTLRGLNNSVEELTSCQKLKDDVVTIRIFDEFLHINDIGMRSDQSADTDFLLKVLEIIALNTGLRDFFQGPDLARRLFPSLVNCAKGSFPKFGVLVARKLVCIRDEGLGAILPNDINPFIPLQFSWGKQ
mmetsp:Transcript_63219/g.169034  ORF Transcript_63219/g.169034 Transcript_63219/m.169034 type:complete len:258 (+) Transcript_63219:372-1145(+)